MKHPKVVILCGGLGTRLREETEFKPKPMVEVGGLPILWHIMKHYDAAGFRDFVLCLGYKGRMIKEYFMNYEWDSFDFSMNLRDKQHTYHRSHDTEDWNITFADTGQKSLTGGRIRLIEKYIPEDDEFFLLTYGDGVSDVDINALIAFHKKKGKLLTITGVHPVGKFGLLKVDDDFNITGFNEKPPMEDFINGGFMVIDRKIFSYIKEDCAFEVAVMPLLAKEGELAVYPHKGSWHCMDTYKDWMDLNDLFKKGSPAFKASMERLKHRIE